MLPVIIIAAATISTKGLYNERACPRVNVSAVRGNDGARARVRVCVCVRRAAAVAALFVVVCVSTGPPTL